MYSRALPGLLILILAAALLSSACGGDDVDGDARVRAVTSLTVIEDLVRQTGGDRVEVESLVPPGADPHTYEPLPRQVARISQADVVFVNGFGLEPGALEVIDANVPSGTPVVALAEQATAPEQPAEDNIDPHLWLSVDNAREYVRVIREALIEADPEGEDAYETSYRHYLARLDDLDTYIDETLSEIRQHHPTLVTTHAAFAHMADYMGLGDVVAVAERPGQEPSAADIAGLRDTIAGFDVPAVFQEPQLGAEADVLRAAAGDLGVEVCTLYSGGLDDQVPTYVDLMRHNAEELARCLGGEA